VVGKADLGGASTQLHDAYLWQNGVMTDLHTLPGDACSDAFFVNDHHQVVGTSETAAYCQPPAQGEHAFLWEKGQMFDLNQLIPSGSDLELTYAMAINDQGEILGLGAPRGCVPINVGVCGHAYMLIPQELAQSEGLPAAMQLGASSTPRGQASGTRGRAASPARGRLAG
jgi:probable HAF family extracellular repeat protein